MAITDRHVDAVRQKLFMNVEAYESLEAGFEPDEADELGTLVLAGIRLLLEYRCPRGGTRDEIIRLVGELRAKHRWRADTFDPLNLERTFRHLLTTDPPIHGPIHSNWDLLRALVVDTGMDGGELIDFLARARQLADDWIGQRGRKRRSRWRR